MKLLREINRNEKGQAFILTLILLLVGGLIIAPLLTFTNTGVRAGQTYEENMNEVYAADAGVEDAMYRMIKDDATLQDLEENDSHSYSLPSSVNSLPVNVTVTKLALIQGLLGDDEYNLNQPHENWVQFDIPPEMTTRNYEEDWVEYYIELTFYYEGTGNRLVETVGAFFAPVPGDESLIDAPYEVVTIPAMTLDYLASTETKTASGGFAFIWRWQNNLGPTFDKNNRDGTLSFKFKIHDADWDYTASFIWATFKEQDISFVTNAELYKWLIEATAGNTTVRSAIIDNAGALTILTWETS